MSVFDVDILKQSIEEEIRKKMADQILKQVKAEALQLSNRMWESTGPISASKITAGTINCGKLITPEYKTVMLPDPELLREDETERPEPRPIPEPGARKIRFEDRRVDGT